MKSAIMIALLAGMSVLNACDGAARSPETPPVSPENPGGTDPPVITVDDKYAGDNDHYDVYILADNEWKSIKVYDALCSDAAKHSQIWNDWGNDKELRDTMSYSIFEADFSSPVKVRVTKRNGSFNKVEVRPSPYGMVPVDCGDNTVEFEIPSLDKAKVSVEFDGDRYHNLFLFGYEPDPDKPSEDEPGVIYYGPGEHDAGDITLTDGQTLYIDYGAVVYGRVVVDGSHCRIAGHGILSGDKLEHWGEQSWSMGAIILECNPDRDPGRQDLEIRDITVVNGPSWNISIYNYYDVLIDGVNTICYILNGDGIDVVCSNAVEIRNCFLRNYDDCITLKVRHNATPVSDLYDVHIHDNIIWGDFARGIVVGIEAGNKEERTGYLHDVTVEDCIFLHHAGGEALDDLRAAFAIGQYASPEYAWSNYGTAREMKNITARNLVFDSVGKTGRNVAIWQYPDMTDACNMDNVLLENFTVYDRNGVTTPAIYIDANQHNITNLTIRNFTFAGQKILSEGPECVIYGDVDVQFE